MSFFKQNGMRRSLTWKDGMEKVGRDISSKKKVGRENATTARSSLGLTMWIDDQVAHGPGKATGACTT
jgi:hypothetical protein